MKSRTKLRVSPLDGVAFATLLVIGLSLPQLPVDARYRIYAGLLAFAALLLLEDHLSRRWQGLVLAGMGVLSLWLLLAYTIGMLAILSIIWAAVLAAAWPLHRVLLAVGLFDLLALFGPGGLAYNGYLPDLLSLACFQGFAALTLSYARRAEETRDHLARVNADLLATRSLLAETARNTERLRLARELHDVVGHKLTALRLNLRALAAGQPSESLHLAEQLAAELLADIRHVVQEIRADDGLDLHTALHALATPFPRPQLRISIAADVKLHDPLLAETLLRVVQEALTNSARHSNARNLHVRLGHEEGQLHLHIEDDGQLQAPLREGNGLAGMRERIHERHGRLVFSCSEKGALRIDAVLPA
ncbi:two-component sensor histidine kinase [Lysobacteraceae bacterium NML71-0210]|nr:two-component sensor histidine kinase [Xanthomonadaceae bacterium NML71-0210]